MKKATTLKPFRDLAEGVCREIGDTFSVNEERADYLESLGLIKVEDIAEKKPRTRKAKE